MKRPIATILYSTHFERAIKKAPPDLRQEAGERENVFRENCFDARLKTHKLAGQLDGCWSFSISYSYRILFRFLSDDSVLFLDVGDHSIYQ